MANSQTRKDKLIEYIYTHPRNEYENAYGGVSHAFPYQHLKDYTFLDLCEIAEKVICKENIFDIFDKLNIKYDKNLDNRGVE